MPHCAKTDMKRCAISHAIARSFPTNTCKKERDAGCRKMKDTVFAKLAMIIKYNFFVIF